jgi:hypothetical protein
MHDNPIPGETNEARDGAAEAATLDRVLWLYPTHLTERELLLNLYAGDGGQRAEMFERAIRDLVAEASCASTGSRSCPPSPPCAPSRSPDERPSRYALVSGPR